MEIKKQPKLTFSGVDIITFDFKSSRNFGFEVDPTIGVEAKLVNNRHASTKNRVWMKIVVRAEGYFNLTIVGLGNFELLESLSEDEKKTLLHTNAPPIMFPYIRALISNFTANCGDAVPLLIVPTQFFSGQLEDVEVE